MNPNNIQNTATLAGRILMSAIFIIAGFNKISGYAGTQGYMEAMGVPGMLLPAVIALELGGGLMLLIGLKARIIATLLAGFSVLAGILFHLNPNDQIQMIMLMKNFAIAGGLLFVVAYGAGKWSLDGDQK